MSHQVISVSPEMKNRLENLRAKIKKENGYRLSYSDLVKMLLHYYEQHRTSESLVEQEDVEEVVEPARPRDMRSYLKQ